MKEEWFESFKIAKFSFKFRAEENGIFPKNIGNALRGGFGYTFKDIVCHDRDRDCKTCELVSRCIYSYIFETSVNINNITFPGYTDIPRPFVIEPDYNQENHFTRDKTFKFDLVIIGKAIEHFPYFIFCFYNLGRRGIGNKRFKFSLEEVYGYDFRKKLWFLIYDNEKRILTDDLSVITADQLSYECNHNLKLNFLTPTRIKYRGSYIANMEFHIMIRNLLRRIFMMSLFHCDFEPKIDFTGLINEAKKVDVYHWEIKWHDWERFSTRKDAKMKLGGFIGSVIYRGNFENFMPFIALGEQIHIGKNTTFGLGKYVICYEGRNK